MYVLILWRFKRIYLEKMPNITTSVNQEIYNLAREKHVKWSEALTKGILVLIREAQRMEIFGERVSDETLLSKKDKLIQNLSESIENLEKEVKTLKNA